MVLESDQRMTPARKKKQNEMSYQLSKKQIIKEIVACGKDPTYFLNNYAKISHPLHGSIPFKTYDFQTQLLKDFNDYQKKDIIEVFNSLTTERMI